ncbi:Uncharacterised protein [Vibrio cholerae]|nr:Uncharacterised protein [Vibrio cholerae]CSI54380.1 Uncharacterised protein [Vibrio cholerae]
MVAVGVSSSALWSGTRFYLARSTDCNRRCRDDGSVPRSLLHGVSSLDEHRGEPDARQRL